MSPFHAVRRRSLAVVGVLLCVLAVVGLVPSAPTSAQSSGESVETTLLAKTDAGGDRAPVEGAEIIVYEAVIVDRQIESTGAEVDAEPLTQPATCRWRFPLPVSMPWS